jgi:hypothetical protein
MRAIQPGGSIATDTAPPPVEFDAAHAELLADPSIQFELPQIEPRVPEQRAREEVRVPSGFDLPSAPAGAGTLALFWIVVGLAAAGLLYLIVRRLAEWRRPTHARSAEAEADWRLEEAPARQLLGDADALAAAGRYSEAAHLLLHRSIEEIDRRRPATVRKALTSRDIAGLPSIPPSPAAAFGAIVRAVERSLFGGRPLGADDWQICRSAYERFAFAGEWQG